MVPYIASNFSTDSFQKLKYIRELINLTTRVPSTLYVRIFFKYKCESNRMVEGFNPSPLGPWSCTPEAPPPPTH